jgi:TolB-like protein
MSRTTGEGDRTPEGDYVFISYARPDEKAAGSIIEMLEAAGFKVWWDGLIPGGERFGALISDALEGAGAVVVLWSANATASHWVQDEASWARDHHCLVPISLDGSQPPLGFRQFQCLDISQGGPTESNPAMRRAVQAISDIMGRPARALPQIPRRAGIDRRLLLGAGVAMAAGGGLVTWRLLIAPDAAEANSIAVLPFQNLSGDAGKQYLSDGLAAELRAKLARNPLLSVVGQSSSNAFRDRSESSQSIASKLRVANLLDGNVRAAAGQVRIAVELIDGDSGFSRWSRTFERGMTNLLQLQMDVAEAVGAALSAELSGGKETRGRSGGTENVGAFDAFLRGKELFDSQQDEASDRAALAKFSEAVRLDPSYAAARAARSRALAVIGNQYAQASERWDLYSEAVAEARQAIRSGAEFADGYAALGYALFYGKLDVSAAEVPYRKAVGLGAGSPDVLSLVALYRARRRQFTQAAPAIERAQALDPLNPSLFKTAGRIRFASGDFEGAMAAARRALEINPAIGGAHGDIANGLLMLGRLDEASAEFGKEKVGLLAIPGKAITAIRRKDSRGAQAAFDELVRSEGDNGLYQQAQVLTQWGRIEPALDALDQALQQSDSGLVYLFSDPFLAPLHREARYKALLRKLQFV